MAFDAKAFMDGFTDRFSKEVDSHAIAKNLEIKKVIPPSLKYKIEHTNPGNGTLELYMHIRDNADLEALHKLCDVMIEATGYQQTRKLGSDMKEDLPPLPGQSIQPSPPENQGQSIQPSPPENQDSLNTSPPSETSDIDIFLKKTPSDVGLRRVVAKIGQCENLAIELGIPIAHVTSVPAGPLRGLQILAYWRDGMCKPSFLTTWDFCLKKVESVFGRNVADQLKEDLSTDPSCVL